MSCSLQGLAIVGVVLGIVIEAQAAVSRQTP
jgi:hypothetical protein